MLHQKRPWGSPDPACHWRCIAILFEKWSCWKQLGHSAWGWTWPESDPRGWERFKNDSSGLVGLEMMQKASCGSWFFRSLTSHFVWGGESHFWVSSCYSSCFGCLGVCSWNLGASGKTIDFGPRPHRGTKRERKNDRPRHGRNGPKAHFGHVSYFGAICSHFPSVGGSSDHKGSGGWAFWYSFEHSCFRSDPLFKVAKNSEERPPSSDTDEGGGTPVRTLYKPASNGQGFACIMCPLSWI